MAPIARLMIIRHGIRLDAIDPTWHLRSPGEPADPPLSRPGLRQAEDIADVLEKMPISGIWCSPYQRAIQTITPTARRLGIALRIEGGLGEWLNPAWLSKGTLPNLQPRGSLIAAGHPIDPDYQELSPAVFPEPSMQLEVRLRVKSLLDAIGMNLDGAVLVGHGATCKMAIDILCGGDLPMSHISMGCITHLFRTDASWTLDTIQTDHLSILESQARPQTM